MKTKFNCLIVFVLCCCMSLTACKKQKSEQEIQNTISPSVSTSPTNGEQTIPETEINNQPSELPDNTVPSEGNGFPEGELPSLYANSYDEYLKITGTIKLPEDFVSYSDISQLGVFKYFVFISDAFIGNYSNYMYTLIDENNFRFSVYVEPVEDNQDTSPLPLIYDVNTMDMRKLSTNIKGRYILNGIEYTYLDGNLYYISWENNGRIFTLGGDSFGDYPVGTNTFAEKLLNANNAEAVIASISVPVEKE